MPNHDILPYVTIFPQMQLLFDNYWPQQMLEQQSIFKLDGYTVVRELAEGSFGEILEVLEVESQKIFALKALLKSHLVKTDNMKEARLEGLLLEILDHPGIIKLHEIRQDDDYLYLIMQLGGRGDLKDLLSKTTTKEQWKPETKKLLAQILDTISYLHSNGIVHCDIKPENIVMMNKGNPKLVDFGTARVFDRDLVTSQILERCDKFVTEQKTTGSAEFISPEGIKGEAPPARDIWAFGVLAYWIFHGKLPFLGGSHPEIFEKIRDSQPHIEQTLGENAKQLIRQCLKKDPSQRPTASHLKHFQYFQQINFKQLFNQKPKIKEKCLVEYDVEKRMFFGNYKARVLKITIQANQLYISYCYPQTGVVKKKIKLQPSDFAELEEPGNQVQFFVRTREDKLFFKTKSAYSTKNCINETNQAIKKFYQL